MRPTEQASQEPGGSVFDLQDLVNKVFPTRVFITSFIVEDREGDILRQAPLWELYQNERALRQSDMADHLFSGYVVDTERQIQGIYTVADAVDGLLRLDPATDVTLETASDAQVKATVARVLDNSNGWYIRASLSKDAATHTVTVDGVAREEWRAAALSIFVAADNARLGGVPQTITLVNDEATLGKERFNRRLEETLRGRQNTYRLWGVALDVNLTSWEQGETAVPYIAATVILVLVVVGVTLRSVRAVGLGFCGLLMLLVWLKGLSNLIGLKSSLTLDLIVPIAMISLGADFLIHAVARYHEEKGRSVQPANAFRAGLASVLGALVLAALSDGIAFFANVTSGIETIVGFGVAAGVAALSSFLVMGILIPLVIVRLDQRRASRSPVFQDDPGTAGSQSEEGRGVSGLRDDAGAPRYGIDRAVVTLAKLPRLVLLLVALITALSTYLAFQLDPKFDIKDFFDPDSDFVTGLDKLDEYTAPALAGEPATIYIQGDLTARESLDGLKDLLQRLGANDNLGHARDGSVFLYRRTLFDLLRRATSSDVARRRISEATGVAIADADADGMPDTTEQIRAAYDYMVLEGVPLDEETLAYDTLQVGEVLYRDGKEQATVIVLGILGAREQANLVAARESLEQSLAPLRDLPTISRVGVTGSPFTREATLLATTTALTISLPVAVIACLLLLTLWMRSPSYAVITVIPVGLVVSWLYAFMYLTGYSLNFVTATIAAVSIGVGIDYSIHMTQRFRQELARQPAPLKALRFAATGTGVAVAGSAASSVIGFAVLGFAPMPLFSTYGVITAVMVLMSAAASLLVLPSMLLLVARWKG